MEGILLAISQLHVIGTHSALVHWVIRKTNIPQLQLTASNIEALARCANVIPISANVEVKLRVHQCVDLTSKRFRYGKHSNSQENKHNHQELELLLDDACGNPIVVPAPEY